MKDDFEEWLSRIACYSFGVSHQAFVADTNRATAQTAADQALAEGMGPAKQWVADVMQRVLQVVFGADDLRFIFVDNTQLDPLTQAQIDDLYIKNGTLKPEEVRARMGLAPLADGEVENQTKAGLDLGEAMDKVYDPAQPRDDYGRWVGTNGCGEQSAPRTYSSVESQAHLDQGKEQQTRQVVERTRVFLKVNYPELGEITATKVIYTKHLPDNLGGVAIPHGPVVVSINANEEIVSNIFVHELLHQYINKELGLLPYQVVEYRQKIGGAEFGEIHNWIYKKSAQIVNYQQNPYKDQKAPVINDYPIPPLWKK